MLGRTTKAPEQAAKNAQSDSADHAVSVISKDMRIVGDCETEGRLRILGTVSGSVRARGVEVGPTGSIEGDVLASNGSQGSYRFMIDGKVEGSVKAGHVEVGENGRVKKGIEAHEVVVNGRVKGGIVADKRVELGRTAAVEGDVVASRLALEEGGRVDGRISMGTSKASERVRDGSEPAERKGPELVEASSAA